MNTSAADSSRELIDLYEEMVAAKARVEIIKYVQEISADHAVKQDPSQIKATA